jgi:proteasome lid subunit RPN8/RPN11
VCCGKPSVAPLGPWEYLLASKRALRAVPLDEIYRHAADAYPDECCGFVRLSGEVHRAVNQQDALHAENPALWPHSAREAYSLSPDDLYLFGMSFFSDDPAIVIYHSHPDIGAYFSDKDIAGSLHDGRPTYDVDHLVIDVRRRRPRGAKLYRFVNSRYRCVWSEVIGMRSRPEIRSQKA